MALDGTTLEVADTPANARAFGRPGSGRGVAAFPQLRAVALIETGTHALCDVVLRPSRCGEVPAASRRLRSVGPGLLARQAHFLGRTKVNVVLEPTERWSDGSFLAHLSPSPKARRHDRDGITLRVIESALDTPAAVRGRTSTGW